MASGRKVNPTAKPKKMAKLDRPTLVHFSYYSDQDIVSATVQQDVTILDQSTRTGADVRIATSDLSADIRKHLDAAMKGIAKYIGSAAGVTGEEV